MLQLSTLLHIAHAYIFISNIAQQNKIQTHLLHNARKYEGESLFQLSIKNMHWNYNVGFQRKKNIETKQKSDHLLSNYLFL